MFVTEVRCYLHERILKVRIGLLWLWLLACMSFAVTDPFSSLPWLATGSALFILAFRLWDDLADRDYDRQHYPGRCLTRTTKTIPFFTSLWLLLAALTLLLYSFEGIWRALAFLILIVAFFVIYRLTARQPKLRSLRVTLVLAKYPAFVLLLADYPGKSGALLVALVAYLPPLLDEVRSTGTAMLVPTAAIAALAALSWLALTT